MSERFEQSANTATLCIDETWCYRGGFWRDIADCRAGRDAGAENRSQERILSDCGELTARAQFVAGPARVRTPEATVRRVAS